jgi:signal transduction histidine kinase
MDKRLATCFFVLLALVSVLGGVTFVSFRNMKAAFDNAELSEKQRQVKAAVQVASAVIAEQYAQETAGNLTREEAQQRAKNILRGLRYGRDGYLWINDFDRVMLMHPIKPELDGKDLTDFKDPAGRRIFLDMVDQARKGSGFVEYLWPKPGQAQPAEKVSYVQGFAPWGWVLGTGLYVEDVKSATGDSWKNALQNGSVMPVIAVGGLLLVGGLIVVFMKGKALNGLERVLGSCFVVMLSLLVVLGGLILLSAGSMRAAFDNAVFADRQQEVRNLVQIASGIVDQQNALETAGKVSRMEAQEGAKKQIRAMRYGDQDYFWINDFDGVMLMHPAKPELEGKNLLKFKDPNGKMLFSEFVETVKTNGSGFVDYLWPKPGSANPVKKVSFVKGFDSWGWVVGTGIYLDDVDAKAGQEWAGAIQNSRLTAMVVFALTALVGGIVLFAPIF